MLDYYNTPEAPAWLVTVTTAVKLSTVRCGEHILHTVCNSHGSKCLIIVAQATEAFIFPTGGLI